MSNKSAEDVAKDATSLNKVKQSPPVVSSVIFVVGVVLLGGFAIYPLKYLVCFIGLTCSQQVEWNSNITWASTAWAMFGFLTLIFLLALGSYVLSRYKSYFSLIRNRK